MEEEEYVKPEKLRVLLIPYNKEPEVIEIDNKLEAMQALVGGLIQAVHVESDGDDGAGVDVWCNEEFLMLYPEQRNRMVITAGEIGYPLWIHGPFYVARTDDDGNTLSLTDADIKKYSQVYRL